MNSIDLLLNNVDQIIIGYVQGSFGNLTQIVTILWDSMFLIFVAFYGYKVIINNQLSVPDFLVHTYKAIAILILATQWSAFSIFVLDIVTNLPSDIAGQLINAASDGSDNIVSANTALGNFYGKGMTAASKIMDGANWGFGILILFGYSAAVWISVLLITGYSLMLIILSKVAVAVILAVGPIFILLLMFTQTKSLFEGWLRTLLNYAIIPIFVYGTLVLLLSIVTQPLTNMDANITSGGHIMEAIAPFILVCFVSILLLSQVMNISSGIVGGLSLSTMGLGRTAGRSIGRGAKTLGRYGRIQSERGISRITQTGKHSPENKLKNAMPSKKPPRGK